MDVREKLIEILNNSFEKQYEKRCLLTAPHTAEDLITNGVTVQEWILVKDKLPEENEYVMIWCGECQIARIEKGISEEQRNAMKRGDLDDPCEIGWTSSSGYFTLKRSESYSACDEGWNNYVPYCWYVNGGMMKLFGQNVTHWMPMPEPPKENDHGLQT